VIRDNKSNTNEFANAKRMKLMTEEKMDIRIIGLLPTLSDSRPNIGENMNCIKEKDPIRIPRAKAPDPTVSG
jgi:hypothetical protein